MQSTMDFIAHLLGDIPTGYCFELRPGPHKGVFLDPRNFQVPADLATGTYYFSVVPRRTVDRAVDVGGMVWMDTDTVKLDPGSLYPTPSAVVNSGGPGNLHVYWKLDAYVDVEICVRLSAMAAVAYGADHAVAESRRVMRIPGSLNIKRKPPAECTVHSTSAARYDPLDLEERLLAQVFAAHYVDGQRHELTMHIAALLARAGWDVKRAVSAINYLYLLNPGSDLQGKLEGVRTTYQRRESGEPVASRLTRELLGDEPYTKLLGALGITSRDGDLILGGEVIGTHTHLQKDLAAVMMTSGNWASAEGKLVRWVGTHWHPVEPETLVSEAFKLIGSCTQVIKGEEVLEIATATKAGAVARVVTGMLLETALPEPAATELPLENGVLNVITRTLVPHRREQWHRWLIPVEYQPGATCPHWLTFLEEAAPGDCVEFLQEWVGYCLMSGNPWQRMLWLHGPSGTGKSTFIKVINDLLGPGATAMGTDKLTEYSLAELAGKRVAVCSEMSPRTMRTTTLKALVAGDPIQARHPYGRPFSMVYTGKLVWGSNAMPPMDQSEGIRRRINVVQFAKLPRVKDDFLDEKLVAELPGILNWALDGADRLLAVKDVDQADWALPPSVRAFVDEFMESADPLRQFFLEEVELVPGDTEGVPVIEFYQRYLEWAKARQVYVESLGPAFYRAMRAHGLLPVEQDLVVGKRRVKLWTGGRLAPDHMPTRLVDMKLN